MAQPVGSGRRPSPNTYKALVWSILTYPALVWIQNTTPSNIKQLQTIQNAALRIATGCYKSDSLDYLRSENLMLTINDSLGLLCKQYLVSALCPTTPIPCNNHSRIWTPPPEKNPSNEDTSNPPPNRAVSSPNNSTANPHQGSPGSDPNCRAKQLCRINPQ